MRHPHNCDSVARPEVTLISYFQPICLVGQQRNTMSTHRLDASVVEWRILDATLPFFATALPWALPYPRIALNQAAASDEIFRCEMKLTRLSLQSVAMDDLPSQSFGLCVRALSKLVQFLDDLVLDRVLEAVRLHEEEENKKSEVSDATIRCFRSLTI